MGGAALALLREALGRAAVQLQELWGDGADRRSLGRRELLAPRAQCESSPSRVVEGVTMETPGCLDDVTAADVSSLRRQVSKLNRRLQRVETEAAERAQRDHLLYGATLALALINTWLWMRR
ncbi:mitochondrial fission factor-like isoform X1 [Lampetra fluviatilis]